MLEQACEAHPAVAPIGLLGDVAYVGAHLGSTLASVEPEYVSGAAVSANEIEQQLERGTLAGTVGSDEQIDRTDGDLERDVLQRGLLAVSLSESTGRDGEITVR